jgi:uncharacterized protein YciI
VANHYIYRIQPTRLAMLADGPTDQEERVISRHFEYLQGLVAQGGVLLAGRTLNATDRDFGIVIFRADSESEAKGVMLSDPAIREGVMRGEVFPYRVALFSPQGWTTDDGAA